MGDIMKKDFIMVNELKNNTKYFLNCVLENERL
jgi:hypothetical protein